MSNGELEIFMNAAQALIFEFQDYEDFDVIVEPDKWHPGRDNLHVVISYGDVRSGFVTSGYNFAYNMQRLFNNEALNKMLR